MFSLGAAGALAGEALKIYEYRGKLTTKKYRQLAKSPLFWSVVTGMLMASGFIAWVVNTGTSATQLQVVLTGIGARGMVRGVAEAGTAQRSVQLGASDASNTNIGLGDLFK